MTHQWEFDLTKTLNNKKTKKVIEPCIGVVVSVSPFKATIHDGIFILTKSNTYICQAAIQKAYEFEESTGTLSVGHHSNENFTSRGVINLKDVLVVGQEILVIPIQRGQKFVVVDVLAGGWA